MEDDHCSGLWTSFFNFLWQETRTSKSLILSGKLDHRVAHRRLSQNAIYKDTVPDIGNINWSEWKCLIPLKLRPTDYDDLWISLFHNGKWKRYLKYSEIGERL